MSKSNLTRYQSKIKKDQKEVDKIHNEINHIFDHHLSHTMVPYEEEMGFLEPDIEVIDTPKAVKISAELPGMEPQDIDIAVSTDGYLTITGEKQHEAEDEKNGYYFSERSYGMIQRTVPLPTEIDLEKVTADFKNGVLKVTIPKLAIAQEKVKKISVKGK